MYNIYCMYIQYIYILWGRDSSVGIATGYGVDGSGIESRWDEVLRTRPDRPWGPPSLPEVKRPGRGADHPPPSRAEVKKE
jgi:hypothetical protein